MKEFDLKGAYPETPEHFIAHARHALAGLEETARRKSIPRKPAVSLTFALAAILLFAGIAFATVQFGLLDYLLGSQPAKVPSDLLDSVQPLHVNQSSGDIDITLTGGLYDGKRGSLSWEITNRNPAQPVLVELKSFTINRDRGEADSLSTNERLMPPPAALADPSPYTLGGGMVFDVDSPPESGTLDIFATFVVSRPVGELLVADPDINRENADKESEARRVALKKSIEDAGISIAAYDPLDPFGEAWAEKGHTVVTSSGKVFPNPGSRRYGGHVSLSRPGQFERIDTIYLECTLDASFAEQYAYRAAPVEPFAFNGYQIEVNEITITPLSTFIDMFATPESGPYASYEALVELYVNPGKEAPYIKFADAKGNIVEALRLRGVGAWAAQQIESGQYILRRRGTLPGLVEKPAYAVLFRTPASSNGVRNISDVPTAEIKVLPLAYTD